MKEEQLDIFEEDAKEISELNSGDQDMRQSLTEAINMLLSSMKIAEVLQERLSDINNKINILQSLTIPELMTNLNLKLVETVSGERLELKEIFAASMPSKSAIDKAKGEKRELLQQQYDGCMKWLKDHDLESIIKSEIEIDVGKDLEQKQKILSALTAVGVQAEIQEVVHAATLKKSLQELKQEGTELPDELFNIYQGNRVEIKAKKGAK